MTLRVLAGNGAVSSVRTLALGQVSLVPVVCGTLLFLSGSLLGASLPGRPLPHPRRVREPHAPGPVFMLALSPARDTREDTPERAGGHSGGGPRGGERGSQADPVRLTSI